MRRISTCRTKIARVYFTLRPFSSAVEDVIWFPSFSLSMRFASARISAQLGWIITSSRGVNTMVTFAELFSLAMSRVSSGKSPMYFTEKHAPMVRRLDQLANHADGLIARVEVDVDFTSFCFEAALLDYYHCQDSWVSKSWVKFQNLQRSQFPLSTFQVLSKPGTTKTPYPGPSSVDETFFEKIAASNCTKVSPGLMRNPQSKNCEFVPIEGGAPPNIRCFAHLRGTLSCRFAHRVCSQTQHCARESVHLGRVHFRQDGVFTSERLGILMWSKRFPSAAKATRLPTKVSNMCCTFGKLNSMASLLEMFFCSAI